MGFVLEPTAIQVGHETKLLTQSHWEPENWTIIIRLKQFDKTLNPGFAKYAVAANLFRLGFSNPKKK